MKNAFAKTRPVTDPYVSLSSGGWTWNILKLPKSPVASLVDPYSRAFCFVTSPICPEGELGEVYCSDIPGLNAWLVDGAKKVAHS